MAFIRCEFYILFIVAWILHHSRWNFVAFSRLCHTHNLQNYLFDNWNADSRFDRWMPWRFFGVFFIKMAKFIRALHTHRFWFSWITATYTSGVGVGGFPKHMFISIIRIDTQREEKIHSQAIQFKYYYFVSATLFSILLLDLILFSTGFCFSLVKAQLFIILWLFYLVAFTLRERTQTHADRFNAV